MIISWLYTGEMASEIQGEVIWGEVPRLLAHGKIWSGHWNGGVSACEPAGCRAELAPPPHLHLLYAAQVFHIKLLFASFPWWLSQFACKCFFSQNADKSLADLDEIFNSPANSTQVSVFTKWTLNMSMSCTIWGKKARTDSLRADYGTQMRSPLSTASSKAGLCSDLHTKKMALNK